jgi:hypothetical protein
LIDSGRPSYIQREKGSARPSITRSKGPKKKVKKNNSLSKIQDTKVELNNVNLQVDEDLLASMNFSGVWTLITSSTNATPRGKGDGQEKECISEAL